MKSLNKLIYEKAKHDIKLKLPANIQVEHKIKKCKDIADCNEFFSKNNKTNFLFKFKKAKCSNKTSPQTDKKIMNRPLQFLYEKNLKKKKEHFSSTENTIKQYKSIINNKISDKNKTNSFFFTSYHRRSNEEKDTLKNRILQMKKWKGLNISSINLGKVNMNNLNYRNTRNTCNILSLYKILNDNNNTRKEFIKTNIKNYNNFPKILKENNNNRLNKNSPNELRKTFSNMVNRKCNLNKKCLFNNIFFELNSEDLNKKQNNYYLNTPKNMKRKIVRNNSFNEYSLSNVNNSLNKEMKKTNKLNACTQTNNNNETITNNQNADTDPYNKIKIIKKDGGITEYKKLLEVIGMFKKYYKNLESKKNIKFENKDVNRILGKKFFTNELMLPKGNLFNEKSLMTISFIESSESEEISKYEFEKICPINVK